MTTSDSRYRYYGMHMCGHCRRSRRTLIYFEISVACQECGKVLFEVGEPIFSLNDGQINKKIEKKRTQTTRTSTTKRVGYVSTKYAAPPDDEINGSDEAVEAPSTTD